MARSCAETDAWKIPELPELGFWSSVSAMIESDRMVVSYYGALNREFDEIAKSRFQSTA